MSITFEETELNDLEQYQSDLEQLLTFNNLDEANCQRVRKGLDFIIKMRSFERYKVASSRRHDRAMKAMQL